ncbi:MAG: hypothetical protein R3E89_12435 [Thiolinea sp.]
MNTNSRMALVAVLASSVLSACSQQQAAQAVADVPEPIVVEEEVRVVETIPAPQPYQDVVVQPAPLKPAPMPAPVIVQPRPAPVIVPPPKPMVHVPVPKVKAKGHYRGAVPIDERLRQQYQQ